MSSQRPPGAPFDPLRGGGGDSPSPANEARTQRLSSHPRPVSGIGSDDGEPQSIADGDVIDAPTDPSDIPPPRGEPTRIDAPPSLAGRGGALVDVASTPEGLPPAEDEDADGTARRHLAEEDALPERERAFGPYTLLRRLAFGGMGEVFLARHDVQTAAGPGRSPARLVVVKRILSHMRRDEGQRRGFVEEARLQTLLRSPNIVQIHDVGEVDGQVYLAMEHVHGPSWRALVDRCRRNKEHIPLAYVVEMMLQAADGLSYAHNLVDANTRQPLRIVHRDINPHNVLVTYDGGVKIIDFGIAKSDLSFQHTETGTIKGKFAYMSPEQSAAEPLDARSDLFALGICFYELVTLSNPFKRGNVVLSLEAIQRSTPPPPSKARPGAAIVDPVIERMLRKNPDDRFADCSEVAAALRLLLHDGLIPGPPQPLKTWLRKLFAPEIANHHRILDETGSGVDAAASSPRLQRPTSDPQAPQSPRPLPGGAMQTNEAIDEARAANDVEPSPAGTPGGARALAPAADGSAGTGPTAALHAGPRRFPIAIAAAVSVAVAVVVVGVWFALRSSQAVPVAAPVHDAGAGAAAVAVVDAGSSATAVRLVDAAVGDAAGIDAGALGVVDGGFFDAGVFDVDGRAADAGARDVAPRDAGSSVVDAGVVATDARPRPPPKPTTNGDVVARIVVAADGFVVKGPRTLGSRAPTLLVIDDKQAPFRVRLRVRAEAGGGARVSVESEPWAIVRVDQIGRGRTPVADVAVVAGRKTLLSLQNPGGAAMEIGLTVTPSK